MIGRIFVQTVGFVLFMVGIIGILTPIPFGLVFLVAAMVLLIPTSPGTVRAVRALRRRSLVADRGMHKLTQRTPAPYRRLLRRTENRPF